MQRIPFFIILPLTLSVVVPFNTLEAVDVYERSRMEMVRDHVAGEGIKSPEVLAAMRAVPRHLFVPLNQRKLAYTDQALPIGEGQTISPPFIVAYMTELLKPGQQDRVLEIGTGSGYQAAVLSKLVKEVYSIEIVAPLGRRAEQTLHRLRYNNVSVKVGDGYQGWTEHAPFDKIIVTCSPEQVPAPLVQQLREGGLMIIPLGQRYQQVFYLLKKVNGRLETTQLMPTLFVPMTGRSEERRQIKPDPLNPQIINGGFENDSNGDGMVDGWHYQRNLSREQEQPPEGMFYVSFETEQLGETAHMLQGFAIDGSKIRRLEISAIAKLNDWSSRDRQYQRPGVIIHFYDDSRRPLASQLAHHWAISSAWQSYRSVIAVPAQAKEAIIQVGLNGAAGSVEIDNISVQTPN